MLLNDIRVIYAVTWFHIAVYGTLTCLSNFNFCEVMRTIHAELLSDITKH